MVIECACGCLATVSSASNVVGTMQAETGFHPVLGHDSVVRWICPGCWPKVRSAVKALIAAVGSGNAQEMYLRGLVMDVEREESDGGGQA